MLERSAGDQTGQSLILFALTICLPPVGILLGNYVKHVALLKAHAQLPARYVRIFLGVVVEMRSYMYLCGRNDVSFTITNLPASGLHFVFAHAEELERLYRSISVDLYAILFTRVTRIHMYVHTSHVCARLESIGVSFLRRKEITTFARVCRFNLHRKTRTNTGLVKTQAIKRDLKQYRSLCARATVAKIRKARAARRAFGNKAIDAVSCLGR